MNGLISVPGKEDGRRLRSADSRRRIIAAMLSLIQEGTPEPAAEAVAQRAGVGLRTVFRLFSDIESLCAEMLVPQRLEFVECFSQPFTAPRGAPRIRELFDRMARLYEKRMPLRRAGTARRYSSPSLAAGMKELDRTIDQFIRNQMPDETTQDRFRIDMLNLLLSYEAWMRLRDEQGKSEAETLAVLRAGIEVILKE
jgi:AcrR family transcriptional regulator